MSKKELQAEVDKVFALLSRIPVTGESVDAMAAARAKLRKVYAEMGKLEVKENE